MITWLSGIRQWGVVGPVAKERIQALLKNINFM